MSSLRISGLLLAIGLLSFAAAARADAPADEARFQAFDLAMARDYLLPRYQALASATAEQEKGWAAFCRQPSADGFAAMRAAFQGAMDAWMPLQHVRAGPASLRTRIERLYFWPERKNIVARQVGALLQSAEAAALEPRRMATASVAVQGFPALQLLLYDGDDPSRLFLSGDPPAAYRCVFATAVAANLTAIAKQIVEDWMAVIAAMSATPPRPLDGFGLAESPKETAQLLFTDLLTLFQLVGDIKLALPLGLSVERPEPKFAEGSRSGRSLRNLKLNLESAQAMIGRDRKSGFSLLLPPTADADALDRKIADGFAAVFPALAAIPLPLAAAVGDPAARPKVEALLADIKKVRDLVGQQLAPAVGLAVGFNGLDGD
jgi:predicted lipoprotein